MFTQQKHYVSPKRKNSFSPILPSRHNPMGPHECKRQSTGNNLAYITNGQYGRPFYQNYHLGNITPQKPASSFNKENHDFRSSEQVSKAEQTKLYYDIQLKNQEIIKLMTQIESDEQEKMRLKSGLEQKAKEVAVRDKEIRRLVGIVHKLQNDDGASNVAELQNQIQTLQKYIDILSKKW